MENKMSFLSNVLAFLKGEITDLKADATAFEHKFLPGAEAVAKKALRVFGEKAVPVLEQLSEALISGLISGGNPSVLIPQLVNDGIKDLEPEAIADGKNVLYALSNLALADATENGTAVAPTNEPAPQPATESIAAPAEVAPAVEAPAADEGQATS